MFWIFPAGFVIQGHGLATKSGQCVANNGAMLKNQNCDCGLGGVDKFDVSRIAFLRSGCYHWE